MGAVRPVPIVYPRCDKNEQNMTNKEPGYIYILTNPSFREDN